MAALPVPTHRASAVNSIRGKPVTRKAAANVVVAVSKFAKGIKNKDTAARDMSLPLLHSM
jgi:hypothetical protein